MNNEEDNEETYGWRFTLKLIAFISMCIFAFVMFFGEVGESVEDYDIDAEMEEMDKQLRKMDEWIKKHPDSYLGEGRAR